MSQYTVLPNLHTQKQIVNANQFHGQTMTRITDQNLHSDDSFFFRDNFEYRVSHEAKI